MIELKKSTSARKKQIKSIIEDLENYEPDFRFSIDRKIQLLNLASDNPDEDQIQVPKSSWEKLDLNLPTVAIKHMPFVAPLIEREVGANAKAVKQFAIKALDPSSMEKKKALKVQKLTKLIEEQLAEDPKSEKAQLLQEQIKKVTETDITLEEEKDATEAIEKFTTILDLNNDYIRGLYNLQSIGELIETVDIFEDTIIARTCDAIDVFYKPGRIKEDISTSPAILENLYWNMELLLDRFDLSYNIINKLKNLKENKSGGIQNTTGFTHAEAQAMGKGDISFGDLNRVFSFFEVNKNTSIQSKIDYDATTELIKIQKFTRKILKKRTKVYRTSIDLDEKKYTLESEAYVEKEGEKTEPTFETKWYNCWYIPAIDEIIYWQEYTNLDRRAGKSDNDFNLYSGGVKNMNNGKPFSWLANAEPLIYLRDAIFVNIFQLIRDNLGIILNIEYKAKSDDISYSEYLVSLINNKVALSDKTRLVNREGSDPVSVGNITGSPISLLDLDNSGNVSRLLGILQGLDSAILSGRGISEAAIGDIGQNSRVANVNYSVEQAAHVNSTSIKMYYDSFAQLYQNIIDILRIRTKKSEARINELIGRHGKGVEIILGVDSWSAMSLGVVFTTDIEELQQLIQAKQHAAEALHQRSIDFSTYFKILKAKSADVIIKMLDDAAAKSSENAQAQAKQQVEAINEAAEKQHEKELQLEQLKSDTAIETATIHKDREIAVAEIKSKTDLAVANARLENNNVNNN